VEAELTALARGILDKKGLLFLVYLASSIEYPVSVRFEQCDIYATNPSVRGEGFARG
jgi:hypothetical protein